jgi:hypothetical protein
MSNYQQQAARNGIPGNTDTAMVAADTAKDIVAARTNYTFYMQRLTYTPTTVAAQSIAVRSKTTTTARYALIPASQATQYVAEFGPEGIAVTAGEALEAVPAAAGPAGQFSVEGYYKLTSVIAHTAASQ